MECAVLTSDRSASAPKAPRQDEVHALSFGCHAHTVDACDCRKLAIGAVMRAGGARVGEWLSADVLTLTIVVPLCAIGSSKSANTGVAPGTFTTAAFM